MKKVLLLDSNGVRLAASSIVTAFDIATVGSKVTDAKSFLAAVEQPIAKFPFADQKVPGQGFIQVPDAVPFVSAGVGIRVSDPDAYVARKWRGHVDLFLERQFAAPVEGCAIVVYTKDAYLADPDINETPGEAEAIRELEPTHVLVAVLAFAGPKPAYPVRAFVRNLAGANHEAQKWTADEIRALAKDVIDYDTQWATVAD